MPRHGEPTPFQHEPHEAPRDLRREHLERLATAVEATTDLRARVVSPSRSGTGTTTLHVVNPHASNLSEDIGCDLLNGEWWLTWPLTSDGTLGLAGDIDGAVKIINHVLGATM